MNNLEQALRIGLADRYAVDREIGRGGMAVVFHAVELKHDRPVAIKAFRPPTPDPVAKSRFLQEIRTVATLSHPHILQLHDSGEVDGILYFVTPFVDGETLRGLLSRGAVAPAEATRIGVAVAGALDHAHRRGVVHRDVKPENILLQDDQPLLADFGIAFPFRGSQHDVRLTDGGYRIGTPAYMSPEQIAGGDVDGRSDIYGLGLVMYEMLSGHKPFEGRPPEAVLAAQVSETPPSLGTVRPALAPSLIAAVERALSKDPERRWSDAGAFAVAMERVDVRWRFPRWLFPVAVASAIGIAGWVGVQSEFAMADGPVQTVLVADFDGSASEPSIARVARELVLLALSQSRVVSPLSPDDLAAVRHAASIPDSAPLPAVRARELAERAGAAAVVTGEVLPRAGGYSVVLRAIRPADGVALVSAVTHAEDAAGLVTAAERAAVELRRGLGERARTIAKTQPLIDVATPSFAAFRKYANALERSRVGDLAGSSELLREAVALDTAFSAAWAQIAVNHLDARQLDSAAAAVAKALERPERLTEAGQYRLRADAAYALDSDPAAAVRWYDRYLEVVKRSSGGRNNRALYLTMLGRWQEARSEFLRAAAENPRGPSAALMQRLNALSSAISLGHVDSARVELPALTGPFREYGELLINAAEGRWTDADHVAVGVLNDATAPAWLRMQAMTTHAASASATGRPDEADQILAAAAEAEPGVAGRWYSQARVLLALARGTSVPQFPSDTAPGGIVLAGMSAGWGGDAAVAERAARQLASLDNRRQRRLGNGPLIVRAASLAGQRDWRASATILTEHAKRGELDAFALDRPSGDLMRWAEARAWLAAGDSASARRALEPLRSTSHLPPNQLPLRGLTMVFARPFLVTQP